MRLPAAGWLKLNYKTCLANFLYLKINFMSNLISLSPSTKSILQSGSVFVPSPLAMDEQKQLLEPYQRLLTLYYIKSGANAVIPGAHTGEFALNDINVFTYWLRLVKEMTQSYGENMLLMAAVGGKDVLKQAELAAKYEYDIALVAPTAFVGKDEDGVIGLLTEIASIIPTFGFELQRAIPGSYNFTYDLWSKIFEINYGSKGASFNTYRSINMLNSAANAKRREQLVLLTGNDDRIVADLFGEFAFHGDQGLKKVQYNGGLLGHFATDTHAVVKWVDEILKSRDSDTWEFSLSKETLAHAVNHCNMELFDALGNFENSVWGVKYRLTSLGLLPGPFCSTENGRPGQAEAIDKIYGDYPILTDNVFVRENIDWMKKEVGIK